MEKNNYSNNINIINAHKARTSGNTPHTHLERKSSRKPGSAKGSRSRSKKRKKADKVNSIWNSLMMTNSRSIASMAKKPLMHTQTVNSSYLKRQPSSKMKPYKPTATALLIPNTTSYTKKKKRSHSRKKFEVNRTQVAVKPKGSHSNLGEVKMIDVRKIKHIKKESTPRKKPPRPSSARPSPPTTISVQDQIPVNPTQDA